MLQQRELSSETSPAAVILDCIDGSRLFYTRPSPAAGDRYSHITCQQLKDMVLVACVCV